MLQNVSNRKALLSILFILGSSTLFSQVNIKERVEIKPGPPLQRSSTQNVVLFAVNPDSNQGRHQEGAILVLYPCAITVTATMDVHPGSDGGYPPTDLAMFGSSGLIAWYKGYADGTHGSSGGTGSYTIACGRTGVELWNTIGYDDVTNVTRSVGPSSATITFEGKLLRYWTFTATATLTATADEGYELASMELTTDTTQINQCRSYTDLHTKLRNKRGEVYYGIPCQNPPVPVTISVESSSDVRLSCADQGGKTISLPYGDMGIGFNWNYQGETGSSTATITLNVEGQTKSVTVNLVLDTTVTDLQYDSFPNIVLHNTKGTIVVRGGRCGGWDPVPDGTAISLEITDGAEWGFLRDPVTGIQGTILSSLKTKGGIVTVEYQAMGENPDRYRMVTVRATSSEAIIDNYLSVQPTDLEVRLGRSQIKFGDTTRVVVKCFDSDGNMIPIPSDWRTAFQIAGADTNGFVFSPDSTQSGTTISGLFQTATYYARPHVVEPDSIEVTILVTAADPNMIVSKVNDGKTPKSGSIPSKAMAKTAKGTKVIGGKAKIATDEPPELGPGYYHYGVARLVVKKMDFVDHFDVSVESGELGFSEATPIHVMAKNAQDAETSLPADEKLTYVLEGAESMYAKFINVAGDTVLFVENARYADARQGLIKIAAVHQNPPNPVSVRVKVVQASDPTKSGECQVQIVEQSIKLVLYGPREIWPVLPPHDQEHSHEDNRTLLEVQMTRNGKPLARHPFKLSSDYVGGSGGHDHTRIPNKYNSPRRPDKPQVEMFRNYGMFVSSQRNPMSANANPVEEQTIESGKAAFGYVASNFGDRIVLRVESKKSSLLFDTISIAEKVPDFELLPDSPNYDKIGGRYEHHGPSDIFPKTSPFQRPDNNHWGMRNTIIAIDSIAANYHLIFPEDDLLFINDVSLPLGGRFDIYGRWIGTLDHEFHRLGRDVDVRRPTIPDENETVFEQLCRNFGVIDPDPENDAHYHLYFWDRGH